MKSFGYGRASGALLGLFALPLFVACSEGEPSDPDTSGTTGAGASVGSGGASAASGGAGMMSGGATAAGGAIGSSAGGAMVMASGGAPAAGGSAMGSGGEMSGSGGMDAGPLDPASIVGDLDGHLYEGHCKEGQSPSYECDIAACGGNTPLNAVEEFNVSGEQGTIYDVTVQVYGVVELRHGYNGGTRRQGGTSNEQSMGDFLYEGGSYDPNGGYNVYALRVEPAVEGVPAPDQDGNNYFLNARDATGEGHEVFRVDNQMTIPVPAGGKVSFIAYDSNCIQIKNNAETVRPQNSGTGTDGALVVDEVSSAMPPPEGFMQPLSTQDGKKGQWLFFDVTKVEAQE